MQSNFTWFLKLFIYKIISSDTQEAPKSLTIDSESSLESFASSEDEDESVSAPPPPPPPSQPLFLSRTAPLLLGRGAFSSYVRNRGEPDGARASTSEPKGRESDAAFTPSPVDPSVKYARAFRSPHGPPSDQGSPQPSPRLSLTLAHQNKIRSMYTSNSPSSEGGGKRPDSSSSTSSMTDWESGQATVRRQPLPKPIVVPNPTSMAHSRVSDVSAGFIRPQHVSINKSNSQASSGFESQSSDSDFGPKRTGTVRSVYTTVGSSATLKLSKNSTMDTLDRLSVRTEVGKPSTSGTRGRRDLSSERELSGTENNDSQPSTSTTVSGSVNEPTDSRQNPVRKVPELHLDSSIGKLLRPRTNHAATIHENDSVYNYRSGDDMSMAIKIGHMGHKSIQDHIIATQMSRLNREMPISDVYHERNLGLGLAPPLSKLLMSATQPIVAPDHADNESKSASEDSFGNFDKLSIADDNQLALPPKPDFKPKPPPIPPKRFGPKPWVSAHPHVTNMGVSLDSSTGGLSQPVSVGELSRRDEGDGRSMTDSHYSGYSPSRTNGGKSDLTAPPPQPQPRSYYEMKNNNAEREDMGVHGPSGIVSIGDIGVHGPSGISSRGDESHVPTISELHTYGSFNPAYEHDEPLSLTNTVGPRIGSSEIAEYMEQVLGTTGEPSENDQSDDSEVKNRTCKRTGKHNSAWNKNKNLTLL